MSQTADTGYTISASGIYKCKNCGNEITCVKGDRCPPCRNCGNTSFKLIRPTR